MNVEHTKALADAEIDADLVGDGGRHYAPDDSYPEYGNGTVRWAYRLGVEAGAGAVPALVAAVERVQALHTPLPVLLADASYCTGCGDPYPCPTIRELEMKP